MSSSVIVHIVPRLWSCLSFHFCMLHHRPPEARPGVGKALALLSQAEAQAIFAHRADVGDKSRLLLAGLYRGARGESAAR